MISFHIQVPDRAVGAAAAAKIDNLTKPKGSLGRLEELARKICLVQQTLSPALREPHNILFAADHGILEEGVSVSPKDVTRQQLLHFSKGGAGINFLCEQHGFKLVLVDAGVDCDLPPGTGIIDRKIRKGTRNFRYGPAMTAEEFEKCLSHGAGIVQDIFENTDCNILSFGEMGSGNTSPSALWMHLFTGIPLEQCIGAGAGLDTEGIRHKYEVLSQALENYAGSDSPTEKMAWFGGYEMVMAMGGMLKAAELGMLIIVDGFIMTSVILAASQLFPTVTEYAVFGHQGDESGHKRMLDAMGVQAILNLGLRLGEGSGAVCAYPILESAVRMINRMDSFQAVDVTKYF